MQPPRIDPPDLSEHGGRGASSDTRLFMQFHAFTGCRDDAPLIDTLVAAGCDAVLYRDLNDPLGVALVTMSSDPDFFIDTAQPILRAAPFSTLTPRPEYTMFGRTYSLGYEPDLDDTLIQRPRRHALTPGWPWAVWYPLRRSGAFARLPEEEQKDILKEHGVIGFAFGTNDLAHDIRLACHGLDKHDNDFVIGLMGKDLHPLSALVQMMRKTRQTSTYLERLGPFFVGRVVYQSLLNA